LSTKIWKKYAVSGTEQIFVHWHSQHCERTDSEKTQVSDYSNLSSPHRGYI